MHYGNIEKYILYDLIKLFFTDGAKDNLSTL